MLVVNVRLSALQPFTNQVLISSDTPDSDLDNNASEETTSIDNEGPTLQWVNPVGNDGVYAVVLYPGLEVTLTVIATDTFGIDRVRFTRWDHVKNEWVEICVDEDGTSDEYECIWTFIGSFEFPPGENAIYAYAYDISGNWTRKRIWLIPRYVVLLPLTMK